MSYTETHFGKLRKVEISVPLEQWCRTECERRGLTELSSYYDSWEEELKDRAHDELFFANGEVYETIEHVESDSGELDIMYYNPDGTITFAMQFYNGGTCLSEMIEDGIKRIKTSNEFTK